MTNTDTDDDKGGRYPERTSPARQTVEDAQGVERIVSREDGSWSPAPTEATANQKARADAANEAQDEKRDARLASLGLKDEKSKEEGGTVADEGIATVNETSSANAASFPDRPPGVGDYTGTGEDEDDDGKKRSRKSTSSSSSSTSTKSS